MAAEELAWVGRAVASALAALHAQGRAHGSVDARHVAFDGAVVSLLDPPPLEPPPVDPVSGRPVPLYGPAALAAPVPTAEGDVRALGRVLHDCLTMPEPARRSARPVGRRWGLRAGLLRAGVLAWLPRLGPPWRVPPRPAGLLEPPPAAAALADIAALAMGGAEAAAGPIASGPTASGPTAAAVAALIALRVPSARPPGGTPDPPRSDPPHNSANCWHCSGRWARLDLVQPARPRPNESRLWARPSPATALSVLAVLVSGAWLAVSVWGRAPGARASGPVPGGAAPVVATGDGRFSIGQSGDVVLTGDWYCRGSPVPALLRPTTGEVFVFDRFPTAAEDVPGRVLATVPGATSLRAVTSARPDCPGLAAVQPGRAPKPIPIPTPNPMETTP
jgi:hypothetical protein